jgi:hypothetical protein
MPIRILPADIEKKYGKGSGLQPPKGSIIIGKDKGRGMGPSAAPKPRGGQRLKDLGRRKKVEDRRMPQDIPSTQSSRKKAMRKFQLGKTIRSKVKFNIGGRANLLEEMGRIDARKHPDAADRAEKRRVIGELNKGYKSGGRSVKRIGSTQQGADEGATGTTRTRAQIEKYHKRSERPKHKQPLRIKKFASGGAVLKGKKVGCQIK